MKRIYREARRLKRLGALSEPTFADYYAAADRATREALRRSGGHVGIQMPDGRKQRCRRD